MLSHLLLALLGDEQLPERPEAASLVRTVDRVAPTQDLGHQVALAAVPGGDLLTYRSVERTEVLLHLPKITQQVASETDELLELLTQLARFGDLQPAATDTFDLGVDLGSLTLQRGDPHVGIRLDSLRHPGEQLDQDAQSRLGRHERPVGDPDHPQNRLLGGRGQIERRLVAAVGKVPAQPPPIRSRPLSEVVARRSRRRTFAQASPVRVELVVECLDQLSLADGTNVRNEEHPVEERDHERSVFVPEQAPTSVLLAQQRQPLEINRSWPAPDGHATTMPERCHRVGRAMSAAMPPSDRYAPRRTVKTPRPHPQPLDSSSDGRTA